MTEPYDLYGIGQGNPPLEADIDVMARDMDYFQSLYPAKMKHIREYVTEACDQMDYKNSPMYDEYPDRMMIDRVCCSICCKIMCDSKDCCNAYETYMEPMANRTMGMDVEEVEAYAIARAQNLPPWGPPPGPPPRPPKPPKPPWGPPPWGPPPGPPAPPPGPSHGPNWMNDLVRVLLLNEMFNRRCRRGNCR